MSVRQEHRYKGKLAARQGRVATDRQREVEAACMVRGPGQRLNRHRRTMRGASAKLDAAAEGFDTATELAEAANAALRLPP